MEDLLPEGCGNHHVLAIHDNHVSSPMVVTNGEEGSQSAVESVLVGWEAMLGCGEKLLVLMVLIHFCFKTREMGVLKKCQNPFVGGVSSLSLKQHRVYVRGRLNVSLLIVNVRVVYRGAGEAIHSLMLDARP